MGHIVEIWTWNVTACEALKVCTPPLQTSNINITQELVGNANS